jgi:hypothetical protein
MKVEVLRKCKFQYKGYQAGDIIDLPDNIAKGWIASEIAKETKESKPKKEAYTPVSEKAVVDPVEEVKEEKPKKRRGRKPKAK